MLLPCCHFTTCLECANRSRERFVEQANEDEDDEEEDAGEDENDDDIYNNNNRKVRKNRFSSVPDVPSERHGGVTSVSALKISACA